MKHRGIIWDLDGTLLDTLDDLMDATNHSLTVFGCPTRSKEEIRRFVGNGAELLIRRALPGKPNDPDPMQVLACFREYYDAHCRVKTAPYPGIMELLRGLKEQGYAMAVVSNKPDSAVKILCDDHFPGLFCAVTGEVDGCPRKPAPDLVFRAVRALGLECGDCVYVGDSEVDVHTARNAAMDCISVLWGFRDRDFLREQGAEHLCQSPADFPGLLKEME